MDSRARDCLIQFQLALHAISRTWTGTGETIEGRRCRQQLLELLFRIAELSRVAPLWTASDRPALITCEDAPVEAPLQERRRGLSAMDLAERLHIMRAGVEVGEHAVGIQAYIHEVIGPGRGQQLGGNLLALQQDA